MAQKVLIVAYYWPPAGGPGVQRWLKFVKYLPDFGIEPIVFVPENPTYPIIDTSLVAEVPKEVTIIKSPIREPYGFAGALSRKQTKTISSGILPKEGKQTTLQKAMLYIRGNYFVPDARVGWVKPSVRFLKDYLLSNSIDVLITTGPPHSLHLIGRDLKKVIPDLKWVADFRDPWTTIGYHDKLKMTPHTQARHKKLEQEVLETADQIIVTSPSTQKEFSEITNTPIRVITNGFDREVSETNSSVLREDTFIIGHFGTLLSDRNPEILWKVLSELVTKNPAFARALQLRFAGKISQEILDSIKNNELNKYFTYLGYLPYNQLDNELKNVNSLLLVEIDSEITKAIIPGKIFEYLATQKPIVAIGPKGADVADILKKTNAGHYFPYEDKDALTSHILYLFENQGKKTEADKDAIAKYHRKSLTSQLATLLKEIASWELS